MQIKQIKNTENDGKIELKTHLENVFKNSYRHVPAKYVQI